MLVQSEQRVRVSAENVANLATAGYKRRIAFSGLIASDGSGVQGALQNTRADLSQGKDVETGSPLDLAIEGDGFFVVESADQTLYTRQGQFTRGADGRLMAGKTMALQGDGGGDIVLSSDAFKITADGVVLDDGNPVATLGLVKFADPNALTPVGHGMFRADSSAAEAVDTPHVRQGAYEASNVSTGDEMVAMMEALRRAEAGQRIMSVYDDLMGRAITTFGGP